MSLPSENIMFTKCDNPVHMYIYLANVLDPNGLQGGRREKNILYIYHTRKSANKYKNHFFLQEINYHSRPDAPLLTSGYEVDKKITT